MRTEAEFIAEGIREYVAKLSHLLELAKTEGIEVIITAGSPQFSCQIDEKDTLEVNSISRTEIL